MEIRAVEIEGINFPLRSALLALALITGLSSEARSEGHITDDIKTWGGTVVYGPASSGSPVIEVNLAGGNVDDGKLQRLQSIPTLQRLTLNRTSITDMGLRELISIKSLASLSLRDTRITDKGLSQLARAPSLESLNIGNTAITDRGVSELLKLPALRRLYLDGTKISD